MKYFVIFLIIAAALGGGGWLYYSRANAAAAAKSVIQATDQVTRRTIEKSVPANGKVASNRDVDIKCQASGTIKVLPYTDVSKEVKPGEVLCQLDPIDMQRMVDTAKAVVDADNARLTEAKLNWQVAKMSLETTRQRNQAALASSQAQAADAHAKAQRTRELYEHKNPDGQLSPLASKEELDTAETAATQMDANVENAKAAIAELDQQKIEIDTKEQQIKETQASLAQDQSRLETAQQNVDYCTVFAPKAVTDSDPPRWFISSLLINIAPGYIVQSGTSGFSAGTTIMTLSDLSHVFVLASVDESNIGQVFDPARGGEKQKVRTTVDAFPGQIFDGEVVRVATKGVSVSNVVTFEVKIEITSENRILLRPEMTTSSNIICASKPDVLAIPAADWARTGKSDKLVNASAPAAPADPAPAASAASAPSTRRGRGGSGAGAPAAISVNGAPQYGIVSVVTDANATETRNVAVGLLGNDPSDPQAGDLYEVISGLAEGDIIVQQKGQDSRFRNQGPSANQLMRGIGGGGGGGGRGR